MITNNYKIYCTIHTKHYVTLYKTTNVIMESIYLALACEEAS